MAKKAVFHINKDDNPDHVRYRVLAVMLSSVPPKTRFSGGNGNLDYRLCAVLKDETHPVIKDNFRFHPNYGTSKEIDNLLSAQGNYGWLIGLENHGASFLYGVTSRTHEVANEVQDLGLIKSDDIKYLKELGKKLLPN